MRLMISLILLAFGTAGWAETPPMDYVNAGEKIKFNGTIYTLKWSANPADNYYKQEYLQGKSTLDDYEEMITVDVLKGNTSPEKAVRTKINELEERKKIDPVTNYAVCKKNDSDEFVLDFTICDARTRFEWNLYRYFTTGQGSDSYLILISYTRRGTLDNVKQFFRYQKNDRKEMIEKLDKIELPEIKVKTISS